MNQSMLVSHCLTDAFAWLARKARVRYTWNSAYNERSAEWHRADDSVWYEVFAFARPAHPLASVGPPFVRLVQRRFAAASLRAMVAAVNAGCSQAGG
jgi:hypothetical protein